MRKKQHESFLLIKDINKNKKYFTFWNMIMQNIWLSESELVSDQQVGQTCCSPAGRQRTHQGVYTLRIRLDSPPWTESNTLPLTYNVFYLQIEPNIAWQQSRRCVPRRRVLWPAQSSSQSTRAGPAARPQKLRDWTNTRTQSANQRARITLLVKADWLEDD